MSTLGLAGTDPPKPGFWRRWFTKKATVFDIVFGVVGPILCFTFDPFVFRGGWLFTPPLLPDLQVLVYLLSGLEILILLLWLVLRDSLPAKRFIGGALCGGGILCLIIGIGLLPFSVAGLALVIGIFGFTPFFTALVYLRNGFQAIRSEQYEFVGLGRRLPIFLGCLLAIAVSIVLTVAIDQVVKVSVNGVIQGNGDGAAFARDTLTWLEPLSGTRLRQIVDAYTAESDAARKERLRRSYFEITGTDINTLVADRKRQLVD